MNHLKEKMIVKIKRNRRTIMHLRRGGKVAWYDDCAAETTIVSQNEAAVILLTTVRKIFRQVEAGEIHFRETEPGEMLVCRNSCLNRFHETGALLKAMKKAVGKC
jgi:hypothetical protein